MQTTKVEIKTKSIIIFLSILGLIYLVYLLRNIVIIFLFAYIFYTAIKPFVDKLEKLNIPRALSVFLIYLVLFILIGLLIFLTINTLISQIEFFATEFPDFAKSIVESINNRFPDSKEILDSTKIVSDLRGYLKDYTNISDLASGNIIGTFFNTLNALRVGGFTIVNSFFGGFLSVFAVIMSSVYMLNRKGIFLEGVINLFPKKYQETSKELLARIQQGLSEWVLGQIILMLSIALFSYTAIMIPHFLGVDNYQVYKFGFLLAVIAGFLEAFPGVGPTITLIIAVILTLGSGASLGIVLYIIISFLLLQQIEGFFIVPNIMKRVVNIDPVLSILGIIGGVQLFGILGAVLSIPIIATIQIVIFEMKSRSEKKEIYKEEKVKKNNIFTKFRNIKL